MKARIVILAAGAALAVAGPAAQTGGATIPSDGGNTGAGTALPRAPLSSGTQSTVTHRAKARPHASTRAARLLHNPGLPAWIP